MVDSLDNIIDIVTIYGHYMTMLRESANRVGVAALKARLSRYLRDVRRGAVVTVMDRETPVATLAGVMRDGARLRVRPPTLAADEFVIPPRPRKGTESRRLLSEDRGGWR